VTRGADAEAMANNAHGHSHDRDGGYVRSLVLRAWLEPGTHPSLRVRVVEIDAGRHEQPVVVTASIDQTCQTVRRWLETLPEPGGER
jgi:hypothetical protein